MTPMRFLGTVLPIVEAMSHGYPNAGERQDAVQDVLLILWRGCGKYDPARAPLEHWARLAARHAFLNLVQKELSRQQAATAVAADHSCWLARPGSPEAEAWEHEVLAMWQSGRPFLRREIV